MRIQTLNVVEGLWARQAGWTRIFKVSLMADVSDLTQKMNEQLTVYRLVLSASVLHFSEKHIYLLISVDSGH